MAKNRFEICQIFFFDNFKKGKKKENYKGPIIEKQHSLVCDICGKVYKYKSSIDKHRKICAINNSNKDAYDKKMENDRWEYAICMSPSEEFSQVSFVNGICTSKGGKHVEYIRDQIIRKLVKYIQQKKKLDVKPNTIKEQLMLFLRCDIENPSFESQTKDYMSTPSNKFGSSCTVSDKYGASSVESKKITVTPSSVVPVNGLEWELSDEGLVAGSNTSNPNNTGVLSFWDGNVENTDYGWNITDQMEGDDWLSQSLQFRVEDSQNCDGENPNTQMGTATANIQIEGDSPVTLDIDFSGYGEAQSAGYDLIKFSLNGVVIGDGQAPGGGLGCESAPVTVNPSEPKVLEPGPHTLVIDFTTNDGQFHVDAYYEITVTLIAP